MQPRKAACFKVISADSTTAVYARFTRAGYAGRVAFRPLSPGSGDIALTISLINQLAQTAVLGAQSASQLELKVIGARMTAQMNTKLADLKAQATDPTVAPLQDQVASLSATNKTYTTAQTQLSGNASAISDVKIQLGSMAFAAANGDSAGFDQALAAANDDLSILQVTGPLPAFEPDGVPQLLNAGLGIQASSAYDLSTPAGQAQANSDIQNAQGVIDQVFATTSQNQNIASTISNALTGQISVLSSQIDNRQSDAQFAATSAAAKLQTQTQTQFHLLELQMSNAQNSSTWLIGAEAALANPPTGGLLGLVQSAYAGTNTTFAQSLSSGSTQANGSNSTANSSASSTASSLLSIVA